MDLPYITKEFEGIGGKIKKKPEHFIVEEVPLYSPSGIQSKNNPPEHLYINFTKQNLNTKDVQKEISKIFNVKKMNIGIAGLKDKNVISKQTMSVSIRKPEERKEKIVEERLKQLSNKEGIKVNWYDWHTNKLRKGHILGNKFRIIISELPNEDYEKDKLLKKTNDIVREMVSKGVPNYFGEQRFGTKNDSGESSNLNRSIKFIKGEKKFTGWIKNFLISVYQSYLLNQYLAKRVNEGKFDKLLVGDIAKKHSTGGLFEVLKENLEREQERYKKGEISFTAPLYGKKMWFPPENSEAEIFEKKIFDEESFCKIEEIPSDGTRRLGRVFPESVNVKKHEEGIELEFFLFKGSFATTILREIMKNF